VTTMTTASGQTLTTETVLPVGAQISVSPLVDEVSSPPANLEPMRYRLQVSAPEGMGTARFLHVLQGGDAGTTPQAVGGIDSAGVQGVMVGTMAVVFPVELGAGVGGYSYFASVPEHILTGLTPGAGYTVGFVPSADGLQVVVTPNGSFIADSGGVIYTVFE